MPAPRKPGLVFRPYLRRPGARRRQCGCCHGARTPDEESAYCAGCLAVLTRIREVHPYGPHPAAWIHWPERQAALAAEIERVEREYHSRQARGDR